MAALARLGAINPSVGGAKWCSTCGANVPENSYQHHAHSCPANGPTRTNRHTNVKAVIEKVVTELPGRLLDVLDEPTAGDFYVRREVADAPTGTRHRGDFLVRVRGDDGLRYFCDLVISYPNINTTGLGSGKGAQCRAKEQEKANHYNKNYIIPDSELVPFAFQPNGYMGPAATRALREWSWASASALARTVALTFPSDTPLIDKRKEIAQIAKKKYLDLLFSARARISAAVVSYTVPALRRLLRSSPSIPLAEGVLPLGTGTA